VGGWVSEWVGERVGGWVSGWVGVRVLGGWVSGWVGVRVLVVFLQPPPFDCQLIN
jgi:hypothetical protein